MTRQGYRLMTAKPISRATGSGALVPYMQLFHYAPIEKKKKPKDSIRSCTS